jgi:hypothetical protein
MLFGAAHDDSRYGGVVATYNDLLRSEDTAQGMPSGLRYSVAPAGTFAELFYERPAPVTVEATRAMKRYVDELMRLHREAADRPEPTIVRPDTASQVGAAMGPYYRALLRQCVGESVLDDRPYDDDDCCTECREHISDPHQPDCSRNKQERRAEAAPAHQFTGRALRTGDPNDLPTVGIYNVTTNR